jgi:hypothetical protein
MNDRYGPGDVYKAEQAKATTKYRDPFDCVAHKVP